MKNIRLVLINEKILGYVDAVVSSDKISLRLNQSQVRMMNPYLPKAGLSLMAFTPTGGVHCQPFNIAVATGTPNNYQIEDKTIAVIDTTSKRWDQFRDTIDPFWGGQELVWLDFCRSSINEMGEGIDTGVQL